MTKVARSAWSAALSGPERHRCFQGLSWAQAAPSFLSDFSLGGRVGFPGLRPRLPKKSSHMCKVKRRMVAVSTGHPHAVASIMYSMILARSSAFLMPAKTILVAGTTALGLASQASKVSRSHEMPESFSAAE